MPEAELVIAESGEALDAALKQLSENERRAISLLYSAHLTQRDAAKIMGISHQRVSVIIDSAFRKIRSGSYCGELRKCLDMIMGMESDADAFMDMVAREYGHNGD